MVKMHTIRKGTAVTLCGRWADCIPNLITNGTPTCESCLRVIRGLGKKL